MGDGTPPSGGGTGPIPQTDAHWEIARTYNADAKRWFAFDGQIWQPSDTVLEKLGEMMAGQSDLILATVAGPKRPYALER